MKSLPITLVAFMAILTSCAHSGSDFRYTVDQFADVKIIRYQIPGWESLSLQQKEYAYHLSEAAKWGRDIIWDQNCASNLQLRHALEAILNNYQGDRKCQEFKDFTEYAKRVFFCNGIHHHYAEDKFFPVCEPAYFEKLLSAVGKGDEADFLLEYIYDPEVCPQRRSTAADGDIVEQSSVNFYEGVSREEVESYYAGIANPRDRRPVSYGLNTKVVKDSLGNVVELPWKVGGIYGPALEKICAELELARKVAENDIQKRALALLIEYYRTGDLRKWDEFNIEWVNDTLGTVDFMNGFVEDYNDPLGRKGAWEGIVNIKDAKASERSVVLSANAQWFEDNSPVDPRFRKPEVKGISAKVINAVCLAGDSYPATAIGINLPNADWIRRDYGSKSVTIANITHAYTYSAEEMPASVLTEFAWDDDEVARYKKYGSYAEEIHTDLHECLGHGSGQLLKGVSSTALGEYSSALEESRADLFGLYYAADPKLVELGIMPDTEAYKAEYDNFIRNGLMVQFNRVELGRSNTEAHMQDRKLISEWCYRNGHGVIRKRERDGKTYFTITDYEALRGLFGKLLAEVQRIKSEGDYAAGKALVENYAVKIDPVLHKEVKDRYEALHLKPYGGFINPDIVPVTKGGVITDYEVRYTDDYLGQMLAYGRDYGVL
ncbi:MAG: dihydrofolate reductase [Bacteroidales bacterium]|nr:dihydrofolate reductase [Bacteroidales bacterium]